MADEWDVAKPIDHTKIGDLPGLHRKQKTSTKAQLSHEHETPVDGDATGSEHSSGSAVAFMDTSTPSARPGGVSLADNAIDNGRFWINDNLDPPMLMRWNASAFESISTIAGGTSPCQAFLISTTQEDADGGRESQIRFKGTQSGEELTTLGYLQFSHDGAANDQKGKFSIHLNNGNDSNAPSKIPITYSNDGAIIVASSVSVLDEDAMGSDSAVKVATQQSIKAYVDAAIAAATNTQQANASGSTTTTSSSYADMNSMSVTSSGLTVGDKILVTFSANTTHSQQSALSYWQLLEGSNVLTIRTIEAGINGLCSNGVAITYLFTATGASHTFKIQWKTSAATWTATHRTITAVKV